MMTFLVIVAVLCALVAAFVVIVLVGAQQAAKDAVVDTMRLDAMDKHHMEVSWSEDGWRISTGTLVHYGTELRSLIDAVDDAMAEIHG
jgi:uncharacterized protein (DUF1810 family)